MLGGVLGAIVATATLAKVLSPELLPDQTQSLLSPFFVLTGALLILVIPRYCQHFTWCAVYGAVIGGVGAFAMPILLTSLFDHGNTGLLVGRGAAAFVLLCVISAAIGCACQVLWAWIYRYACCQVFIQDGTLCPSCAYCIQHLRSKICPECGSAFDEADLLKVRYPRPSNIAGARGRRYRYLLILLVPVVPLVVVYLSKRAPPLYILRTTSYWDYVLSRSEDRRGAAFYLLTASLSVRSSSERGVSTAEVQAVLGPPEYQIISGSAVYYIYVYNHRKDEAYFDFVNDQLASVGYNNAGINDHSGLEPFPAENHVPLP